MKIVFHPRVFSEVDAIMRYYEDVAGSELADDFHAEFWWSGIMHEGSRMEPKENKAQPCAELAALGFK